MAHFCLSDLCDEAEGNHSRRNSSWSAVRQVSAMDILPHLRVPTVVKVEAEVVRIHDKKGRVG